MRGHVRAAGLACLIGVVSVGCASRRAGPGEAPTMGMVRDVEASARLAAEAGRYEAAVRGYAEARRAAIQAGNLRAGAAYALWAGQWAMAAGWGDSAELWLRLAEQEAVVLGDEELAVRALWTLARLRFRHLDEAKPFRLAPFGNQANIDHLPILPKRLQNLILCHIQGKIAHIELRRIFPLGRRDRAALTIRGRTATVAVFPIPAPIGAPVGSPPRFCPAFPFPPQPKPEAKEDQSPKPNSQHTPPNEFTVAHE